MPLLPARGENNPSLQHFWAETETWSSQSPRAASLQLQELQSGRAALPRAILPKLMPLHSPKLVWKAQPNVTVIENHPREGLFPLKNTAAIKGITSKKELSIAESLKAAESSGVQGCARAGGGSP